MTIKFNIDILNRIKDEYGESFYLLDGNQFRKNYLELQTAFRAIYPAMHIAYSYKTNYIPALCKIVDALGGYAEVVSGMEWEIAKRVGVKAERVIFNGPFKHPQAVSEILLSGGVVNIDSEYELPLISKIIDDNPGKIINVGLRCNFDIDDGVTSRFGVDIDSESFRNILRFIKSKANIHFSLIHCHFATRKLESWTQRVDGMFRLLDARLGFVPPYIDLGGGLFGKMPDMLKEQFDSYIPDYKEYAEVIAGSFAKRFSGAEKPVLFIEPGSALVGDVMKFVTKVVSLKTVRGKNIATLLGSIYNINPTLNKKNPPICVYHSGDHEPQWFDDLDFGGYTCIESDYLYRGYSGKIAVGDYVVFGNVGSYSVVLKPPFILPNFPIVDYNDETGQIVPVKDAETFDDLFHTYRF